MGCLMVFVAPAAVGCSADDFAVSTTFASAYSADFAVPSDWSVLLLL